MVRACARPGDGVPPTPGVPPPSGPRPSAGAQWEPRGAGSEPALPCRAPGRVSVGRACSPAPRRPCLEKAESVAVAAPFPGPEPREWGRSGRVCVSCSASRPVWARGGPSLHLLCLVAQTRARCPSPCGNPGGAPELEEGVTRVARGRRAETAAARQTRHQKASSGSLAGWEWIGTDRLVRWLAHPHLGSVVRYWKSPGKRSCCRRLGAWQGGPSRRLPFLRQSNGSQLRDQ